MKLLKSIAVALATISCFACASCSKADEVKVLDSIKLTEEEYAFAIAHDNDSLEASVNELLADMKEDGSLDALINSYFDGTAEFTYENKSTTAAEGDFVMATNAYFPPFESVEGSKFKGVDIEIAYKIVTRTLWNDAYANSLSDLCVKTHNRKYGFAKSAVSTAGKKGNAVIARRHDFLYISASIAYCF